MHAYIPCLSHDLIITCDMESEEDFSMEEVQEFSSQFYEQDQRDSEQAISKILENADIYYQEILAAIAEMDREKRLTAIESLTQQMAMTNITTFNVGASVFVPKKIITLTPVLRPTEFSKYFSTCKIQIAKFTKNGIHGKNYKEYYYFDRLFIVHNEQNRFTRHVKSPKEFMKSVDINMRARVKNCDVCKHDPFGQVKSEDIINMEDFQYYLENPTDEYTRSVRLVVSCEKIFTFAFYFRPFSVDKTWYGFEIRIKTPDGEVHFFQGKWRF